MKYLNPILEVADIQRSIDFYRDALGFRERSALRDDNGVLFHGSIEHGAHEIMFAPRAAGATDRPAGVILYLTLDDGTDIDAAYTRAIGAGATPKREPTDQFWSMRDWEIQDPDGHTLQVGVETRAGSSPDLSTQPAAV